MSRQNIELLQRLYATLQREGWEPVLDYVAEDLVVKNPRGPLDVPDVVYGREGLREIIAAFGGVFDEWGVPEIEEWVDAGDWVLCVARWGGTAKGSRVGVEARQVEAIRVRDGKIVEMSLSHRSKEAALKAVGLSEEDARVDGAAST